MVGPVRSAPNRTTADLSSYPDLVVIYLGMRVNSLKGLATLMSFGPRIRKSVQEQPDGLLLHENLLFSLFPPHAGMPWSAGPGRCRTGSGGSSSCETGAAPASGTRPTSVAARSSRCTSTCRRPGWPSSRQLRPPVARCFQPAAAWECGKDANRPRASQRRSCISGEATASGIVADRTRGHAQRIADPAERPSAG